MDKQVLEIHNLWLSHKYNLNKTICSPKSKMGQLSNKKQTNSKVFLIMIVTPIDNFHKTASICKLLCIRAFSKCSFEGSSCGHHDFAQIWCCWISFKAKMATKAKQTYWLVVGSWCLRSLLDYVNLKTAVFYIKWQFIKMSSFYSGYKSQ